MSNVIKDRLVASDNILFNQADENSIRAYMTNKISKFYVDGYEGTHYELTMVRGMTFADFVNGVYSICNKDHHLKGPTASGDNRVYTDIPDSVAITLNGSRVYVTSEIQEEAHYYADLGGE